MPAAPRRRPAPLAALLAASLVVVPAAAAQDAATDAGPEASQPAGDAEHDDRVVTHHTLGLRGQEIAYTATAGTIPLMEEDGKVKANVFFVAYTLDGVAASERPVTFTFNGGPGSSSVWLHLGAFGPKRVPVGDPPATPRPPFVLEDNPDCLLDVTDLVFIDPVTTGYSRAVPGEDDGQFHGVDEDITSVAEVIRLWTTRNERWASPKFLAGESYGTTRAAGLAGYLQDRHGLYLNGIVLVSSILQFATARFDAGNDLPYALFLPTYCATAFYHGRLAPDLQRDLRATLDACESFALGDYWTALARGSSLEPAEEQRVAEQLARFTGLSVDWLVRADLRIEIGRFCKELLRDRELTAGRLDSRYLGTDSDGVGGSYEYDPSMAVISGPYTAALNAYVRGDLGYESDLTYEILTGRVHPWNFGRGQGYVNTGEALRQAMATNPHLRVHVANGYYDLATPYFATHYTFDHLDLSADQRARVSMSHYPAGHMMYIDTASAAKLHDEIAAFVEEAR